MGTWGIGILDNDLAQDVKSFVEQGIEVGKPNAAIVREVSCQFKDFQEEPDLILGLAWVMAAMGKVPEALRNKALAVIKNGTSLKRWVKTPDFEVRRQVEAQLEQILQGEAAHPTPYRASRRPRTQVRAGDIIEMNLSNGHKAFGQYVHDDPNYGALLQVFNLRTEATPSVEDILASGPKFPPIITSVVAAVKHWNWKVIGHAPVDRFTFPVFKSGKPGSWWLYNGQGTTRVTELSPGGEKYEELIIWGHDDLVRRIERP